MRALVVLLQITIAAGAFAEKAPTLFDLRLPGISDRHFDGTESMIEVADRPLERLEIRVSLAPEWNLVPGGCEIRLNGRGATGVFNERTTSDTKLFVMRPKTLQMRPDEVFDPWENTIEVTAEDPDGQKYSQSWIIRRGTADRNPHFNYSSAFSTVHPDGIPPDVSVEEPKTAILFPAGRPALQVGIRGVLTSAHRGASLEIDGQLVIRESAEAYTPFDSSTVVNRGITELILRAEDSNGNQRTIGIPVVYSETE